MKLYMFRAVPLPIIRSLFTYARHWYTSYRFEDSFRTGPGWKILVLLESCLQTCTTYTSAERTVNKLMMMDRGTPRNMQIFMPE